jgi:thiosulfate/3-mercaptopyruvate sulfurtransferase
MTRHLHPAAPADAAYLLRHWLLLLTLLPALGQATHATTIVERDWLAARMSRPDVVVVDVRPADAYQAGHIAGAISLPVDRTFASGARDDLLAPITVVRDLLSGLGIANQDHLVLYDDGSFFNAARVFWALEVFGHRRVSLLNSGFRGWQAAGLPVATQATPRPPTDYVPRVQAQRLATAFSTRLAIDDPAKTLIDVRSEPEYQGRESIARRFGHIPSAVNIFWKRNLVDGDADPRIRPLHELAQLYDDIDPATKVITYCNKGRHAALTYLILHNLGYDVAAYDGSWFEWGNADHLPIENPAADAQTL